MKNDFILIFRRFKELISTYTTIGNSNQITILKNSLERKLKYSVLNRLGVQREIDYFPNVSTNSLVVLQKRLFNSIEGFNNSNPVELSSIGNIRRFIEDTNNFPNHYKDYIKNLPSNIFIGSPPELSSYFIRDLVLLIIRTDLESLNLEFPTFRTMLDAIAPDGYYTETVEEYLLNTDIEEPINDEPEIFIPINEQITPRSTISISTSNNTGSNNAENNSINNNELEVKLRDLRVRYSHCFGIIKDKNNLDKPIELKDVFFSLDFEIKDNKIIIHYQTINKTASNYITKEEYYSPEIFTFPVPKLGFINTDYGIILLERKHRKTGNSRYRRGFRFDTVKYNYISSRELLSLPNYITPLVISQRDGSIDLLSGTLPINRMVFALNLFFNIVQPKELLSTKEVIESVTKFKMLSNIFSSKYALYLDSNYDVFILLRGKFKLGVYHPKDKVFYISLDTFNNELDSLKIPYKVWSDN